MISIFKTTVYICIIFYCPQVTSEEQRLREVNLPKVIGQLSGKSGSEPNI